MISIDAFAPHGSGSERATTRKSQWFVETRAGILPMTAEAIEESVQRGLLHAMTKVWTSGMRAWEPLGSIAGFTISHTRPTRRAPQPDEPQPPPVSCAPLPALGNLNWGPASEPPAPAPVHTLIRPRARARSSRPSSEPSITPAPSRQHWRARGLDWVRSLETWKTVLVSLAAGTALGLATYHPLLWGTAVEVTQSSLQASTPPLASAAKQPPPAPVALAATPPSTQVTPLEPSAAYAQSTALTAVALAPPASAEPALQAKPAPAKRSKRTVARRIVRRPPSAQTPEWP